MLDLTPPKLYVNGFPKSGLHLAVRMSLPLFPDKAVDETVWFGTNAWGTEPTNLNIAVETFEQIRPATYLIGHSSYMPEIEKLLDALKILMLFVYRDPRDVVVSQAHHILDDMNGALNHPGRDRYSKDLETVIMECIEGIPGYPGICARWELFEPWIGVSNVFAVRFEDLIKKPHWAAKRFFEFVYGVAVADAGEQEALLDEDLRKCVVDYMVFEMGQRHLSTTYRKGKAGGWKRAFTPAHVKAFKDSDTTNALLRLGYVRKEDW